MLAMRPLGGLPLYLLNGVRVTDEDRIPNAGTVF